MPFRDINPDQSILKALTWLQPEAAAIQGASRASPVDQRLIALRRYGVVDTEQEDAFDDLARLAGQICGAPIALISFVEEERQWFKARLGLSMSDTPIRDSICAHVVEARDMLVIPDLRMDLRTCDNALVTGEPHVRFYAGAPLVTQEGHVLGTLCVLDHEPRPDGLSAGQASALARLARQVMALLDLRRTLDERDALVGEIAAAARRTSEERRQLIRMFDRAPSFMAMLRGPDHVFDFVNPAFMKLVGGRKLIGQPLREAIPEAIGQGYIDRLDTAYRSGEAYVARGAHFATEAVPGYPAADHFVDFVFQPISSLGADASSIFVIGSDVTERVKNEKRQSALTELGDTLRDIDEVGQIALRAAKTMNDVLGGTRAGFGIVDAARETVEMQPDWCAPGIASVAGFHHFRNYGSYIDDLKRGELVIISDVTTDPRTSDNAQALLDLGIRCLVNLPILEHGTFVLVLFIHDDTLHEWTADDLSFLRQIADRTQVAIGRARAEEQRRVLNAELSHRLKNTLAMVQAVASQTLRGVTERDAVAAFNHRIHALSTAHELLLQRSWAAAPLDDVVQSALGMLDRPERFRVDGPTLNLAPRAALSLALLLHELGTNAIKYGALKLPTGRVDVTWGVEENETAPLLVFRWQESGGPKVEAPQGRGFGSRLISMGLTGSGDVDVEYAPDGFKATIRSPLAQIEHS